MARHKRDENTGIEETRDLIITTARHLFMTFGYRAVTTRQVADACGLTQPALYHHFANKQDLYVAVLNALLAQMYRRLTAIAGQEVSVIERLEAAALHVMDVMRDNDIEMMFHDIRFELLPEAQKQMEAAYIKNLLQPFTAIFADGYPAGILAPVDAGGYDATTHAVLFLSLITRVAEQNPDGPTLPLGTTPDARVRRAVEMYLFGAAQPH